jgi:uncharacterized protein YfaS (alpha-2-macroglobulin family)
MESGDSESAHPGERSDSEPEADRDEVKAGVPHDGDPGFKPAGGPGGAETTPGAASASSGESEPAPPRSDEGPRTRRASVTARLREGLGEKRWLHLTLTFWVVAASLAIYGTLQTLRSPWLADILRWRPAMQPGLQVSRGPLGDDIFNLMVQPAGKLDREFPKAIIFHIVYRDVQKGAAGLVLTADEAKPCIRVTPFAPGQVVWTSAVNLEYRFAEALPPLREYRVEVDCIPVTPEERLTIKKAVYSFTTPSFGVFSAALQNWTGPYLTARVEFNLPVERIGIRGLISVFSGKGKSLNITNLVFEDLRSLMLTFPNPGEETYEVVVKEGLRATVGDAVLRETVRLPLVLSRREVYIRSVVAEEGERGFSLVVNCNIQQSEQCPILPETVKDRLTITPSLETRVLPSARGFRITGPFLTQQTYEIILHAGIRAGDAVLRQEHRGEVDIPAPSPRVQFPVRGRYLGRSLGLRLPVRLRDTEYIGVSIDRIPPENWLFYGKDRWSAYRYREPILSNTVIPVEGGKSAQLMWLDLSDLLDTSEPGIYAVSVERREAPKKKTGPRAPRAPEDEESENGADEGEYGYEYWEYEARSAMRDEMTVIITDLALIAKRGSARLWAWAVDARTGKPRRGVRIALYSQKNVMLGNSVTGDDGGCVIPYETIRERVPTLAVAQDGAEFSFISLDETEVSLEPFSVSGMEPGTSNLVAYFYAERDLYRPGETVHFAVLVRNRDGFSGVRIPATVEVSDPYGRKFVTLNQMTDDAGLAAFQLEMPAAARTGVYRFSVRSGETDLTADEINVEAFVPERMTVTLTPDHTDYAGDEAIGFKVKADYLFGAPAAGAPMDFICVARESSFSAPGYEGYRFGRVRDDWQEPPVRSSDGTAVLNEKGEGHFNCNLKGMESLYDMAEVRIGVTVQETGSGRVSRAAASIRYHPYEYYIGLKSAASRVEAGKLIEIEGILLTSDGTVRSDIAKVGYSVAERIYEYGRIWEPESNRFRWETGYRRYPTGDEGTAPVKDGKFKVRLTPTASWVDYAIEVRDPDGRSASDIVVHGWTRGARDRMESPEVLKIRLDRAEADFGDAVTAEVLLPFEGRILWTTESEGVLRSEWQDARGPTARLGFSAPAEGSTVYVSALLLRTDDQYLVRRAFGVSRLPLRPSRNRLDLALSLPAQIRPGQTLKVTLKGSGTYEATVAIVDEGILQVTDFASPDVYEGIFRNTALKVRTYETLGWIVPKGMTLPGGGDEIGALKIQPAVQLVSFWSGVVKSNSRGVASVSFKVPAYLGKLRVMASAMSARRLASAEASVTVTTEVAVLPTFPRYLYKGDTVQFPVTLMNTTRSEQKGTLSIQVNGEVSLSADKGRFALAPAESAVVWVPLAINRLSEFADVAVKADWGKDRFEQFMRVPVLPDSLFLTESAYAHADTGKSVDLLPMTKGWIPEHQNTRVTMAPSPALSVMHHLKYLIRYPYGCVEQVSSALLPLVRLRDIVEGTAADAVLDKDIALRVRAGIGHLVSLQTPSGSFSFWPGGPDPGYPFASIYATFILLQAKSAGYEVPDGVLKPALDYIQRYARAEAFGYYVLAEGNRLQPSDIEHLLRLRRRSMSAEERYFLAAAMARAGKTATAREMLDEARTTEALDMPTDSSRYFYSTLRAKAVALFAQEIVGPGAPENESDALAVVNLLKERRHSYFFSTQEIAWATLALGMRLKNAPYSRHLKGVLRADGRELKSKETRAGWLWSLSSAAALKSFSLENASDGIAYIIVENSGFKPAPFTSFSEGGLRVEKSLVNSAGTTVSTVLHGETYYVRLIISNTRATAVENAVIEDFIPAGLELDNPRLPDVVAGRLTRDARFNPDYVDYRDERIRIFGTVPRGTPVYYYQVRATLPGSFFLPPVTGVAMYDPKVRTGSAPARLDIARSERSR